MSNEGKPFVPILLRAQIEIAIREERVTENGKKRNGTHEKPDVEMGHRIKTFSLGPPRPFLYCLTLPLLNSVLTFYLHTAVRSQVRRLVKDSNHHNYLPSSKFLPVARFPG